MSKPTDIISRMAIEALESSLRFKPQMEVVEIMAHVESNLWDANDKIVMQGRLIVFILVCYAITVIAYAIGGLR